MKLGITTEKFTTPTKIIIPKVRLTDKAKTFLKNNMLKHSLIKLRLQEQAPPGLAPNKDKPK